MSGKIVILGVFVADTAYRAERAPHMGETIIGNSFALGPGGKGSNQAVAVARLGGDVSFISKLGNDPFAAMALKTWADAGVKAEVTQSDESYTGAACIFIEEATGNNAIIICPGVASTISAADMDAKAELIRSASVFVTQLEQPLEAAVRALEIAREAGVCTILNPAPARRLPAGMLALCDYITPNESEAQELTGLEVRTEEDASRAAEVLLSRGVGTVVITLGEKGALLCNGLHCQMIQAFNAGPVVETTGAGDAFNGGLAMALARGDEALKAVRFGCATAGISVTRAGTAPAMPALAEVEELLQRHS